MTLGELVPSPRPGPCATLVSVLFWDGPRAGKHLTVPQPHVQAPSPTPSPLQQLPFDLHWAFRFAHRQLAQPLGGQMGEGVYAGPGIGLLAIWARLPWSPVCVHGTWSRKALSYRNITWATDAGRVWNLKFTLGTSQFRYFEQYLKPLHIYIKFSFYPNLHTLFFFLFLERGRESWSLSLILSPGSIMQWLRIRLPVQATRVRSLVREDPTCRGATKPVRHNYWACTLEPASHNYWARVLQLLKPTCLEPVLRNKRSHCNENPVHRNEE